MSSNSFCSHCSRGAPITTPGILSPVNELLISNQPPLPPQRDLVYDFIREIRHDIETIDKEISRAKAVVDDLLAKRKVLREIKRRHQAIVSPLRQLPHELLSEIFIHCLPPFPTRISPSDAPLLLEQICRRWRDIARSTPTLWSSICLPLDPQMISFAIEVARTWPARSGIFPLSIVLGVGLHHNHVGEELETHPALPILFSNSGRWVDLGLHLPAAWVVSFDEVKERLPLLQKLTLSGGLSGRCMAFEHAKMLRTLDLDTMIDVNDVAVPWGNLTKFITRGRSTHQLADTLRICFNLVECELKGVTGIYFNAPVIEEFTLVHLQTLQIGIVAWTPDLFDSLTLPSLRSIDLKLLTDNYDYLDWDSRSAFLTMLSRSGSILQSLSLDGSDIRMYEVDLLACLKAAPSLVRLIIKDNDLDALTDSVLKALTPVTSIVSQSQITSQLQITPLVPRLEILRIEFERRYFTGEMFAHMVQARWRLGAVGSTLAKLHTIGVTLTNDRDHWHMHGVLTCLRTLEKEGMRVDLTGFD